MKYTQRYFLSIDGVDGSETEVSREQWMIAEQSAGFHSKTEGEPATGGFSGNGVEGRIKSELIEFKDLTSYGYLMSLSGFLEAVEQGAFIDYDGYGHLATETQLSSIYATPSTIVKALHDHPEYLKWATHVMWYNR